MQQMPFQQFGAQQSLLQQQQQCTPSFESLTKSRLLCEKRYFLNNSNSKWVAIGVIPTDFHIEIVIDGTGKSAPLSLNLINFTSICRAFRSMPEFKYAFPTSACDYGNANMPVKISKITIKGNLIYQADTPYGPAFFAATSIWELLKYEKTIAHASKCMLTTAAAAKKKFSTYISKDFDKLLTEVDNSEDMLLVELFINFNDLLKTRVENKCAANTANNIETTTTTTTRVANKRKATAAPEDKAAKKAAKAAKQAAAKLVTADQVATKQVGAKSAAVKGVKPVAQGVAAVANDKAANEVILVEAEIKNKASNKAPNKKGSRKDIDNSTVEKDRPVLATQSTTVDLVVSIFNYYIFFFNFI